MIGREGNSLKLTEDTGWLIGQGILDHGALTGTIKFYPYGDTPDGEKMSRPVIQNWAPRMIQP